MTGQSSHWCGRKVLVTGCSGFLGAAVARELLDRRAQVIGLLENRSAGALFARDRDAGRFHIVHGRPDNVFCIYTALAVHEVTAVFHLGDECGEPPAAVPLAASIASERDTAGVLRASVLRDPRLPVIVARPAHEPLVLGAIAGGMNPNGIVRFGELFGGGDRRQTRIVPRTIAALLAGEIPAAANSTPRDFVYVRDAARACLAVAEELGSGTALDVTFRSGWEMSEEQMARAIRSACNGQTHVPIAKPRPDNPFGWNPESSFDAAMRETIEWYRLQPRPDHQPLPWRSAA